METTILDQHEIYYPELQKQIQELKIYYQEKLWFQLGESLIQYIKFEPFQEDDHLIQLYQGFVKKFEQKIDQIKLMMFIMKASTQFKTNQESIEFLISLNQTVVTEQQPKLLLNIQKGNHLLNMEKQEETLAIIQETKKSSKTIFFNFFYNKKVAEINITIEPIVQASLHQLCARYYKFRNNYEEFYMNSLQYLAYTPETEIMQRDKIKISFEMAIAILISKNMYNFSELLEQPVLQALKNTEYSWIHEFLVIFNNGDVNEFNQKMVQYESQLASIKEFSSNLQTLQQKIKMMGFLELLFYLPKNDRNVSFEQVAQITKLDLNQIEFLLMKAMSLQLIKGSINQVKQMVKVDWVMPRVLDKERIGKIKDKLKSWNSSLSTMLKTLENQQQIYA